ncbi:phage tail sheath family protein [Lyngbya confervoides]|uniref:DUF2586 family protein n=1 Tax=Lyngbya confervoides BDU141951 TaxID=1574623 RepID=A0ABD4T419_9CYAN|nr:phage tail sheath C-terminal domain-containing protein [Lyngbya confervoides]MCM1983257.1 DUF2586 family protein [Lyngbya confervoides BDU141951]
MPVRVTYPGVYIQEVPSGVRTITGVSTSVAALIGMVQRGRLGVPTRVLSVTDYERQFGTDTSISEMTDQVRQFFLNGGQEAWIVRIAQNALTASVQLREETGNTVVMTASAKEAGPDGNLIRLEVDYNTPSPEQTFNLRVFRPVTNALGVVQIETDETFSNLSMDPASGRYAATILNQQSTLIDVEIDQTVLDPLRGEGYALSGLLFDNNDATALATLNSLLGPTANSFQISVDGSPLVPVVISAPLAALQDLEDAIDAALTPYARHVRVSFVAAGLTTARYLEIRSVDNADTPTVGGSVQIQPSATNDVAVALQIGSAQGGIEVSGYAPVRPAPSAFFARLGTGGGVGALSDFAEANDLGTWILSDASGEPDHMDTPTFVRPGNPMYDGTAYDVALPENPGVGSLRNVRQNLQQLADSINANATTATGQSLWNVSVAGYRLVLRSQFGGNNPNVDISATLSSDGGYDLGADGQFFDGTPPPPSSANVTAYSLGTTGSGDYQTGGSNGTPGNVPTLPDYRAAFVRLNRDVDIFNLMILPRATGQSDTQRETIWGAASAFCRDRRAFLLVDPRETWTTANQVDSEIVQLRVGVVTDHAAIYWPRIRIPTASSGLRTIDPSGSIAGLMARTDSNRGVWKAPAGLEASFVNVRSVEHRMSDPENGLINPQAVNAIRLFPTGIVSWGARTMVGFDNSGNDDYKYVPIRRIALFIEESLFRGLKFAVFEPNDEPLWAQIRLAAGAFMNNLFRQGAFQGQKASDAYFVKVDSETTTQNDINLGIVNVVVGFAPLRPAEFVVITIQQMAGQVQT